MLYIREDIPSKAINGLGFNIEAFFVELNLRKKKWLLACSYNPHCNKILDHLNEIGKNFDIILSDYDNIFCYGDYNAEAKNISLIEFCKTYELKHLIKEPTCFKNPDNPKCIDLILTNFPKSFQNSIAIDIGLSDFHKMTITVMKSYFPKQSPNVTTYRCYKTFSNDCFRDDVISGLIQNESLDKKLRKITKVVDKHAPKKKKYIRGNQLPYMNKALNKAIMTRTRLKNKYFKNQNEINRNAYKKQRNFCVSLFRREKRKYSRNFDIKKVTDNKQFRRAIKPAFSDKCIVKSNITLIEENEIISKDQNVADVFNKFFSNVVSDLEIPQVEGITVNVEDIENPIKKAIVKYSKHPSILEINKLSTKNFSFHSVSIEEIKKEISNLDVTKCCQVNDIPTKIVKENSDIFADIIFHNLNDCFINSVFPENFKTADVIPIFKKGDRVDKDNYRPVSILSNLSKIYEWCIYSQMADFFENILSKYQCGFRKGLSAQQCLLLMIEKWKKSVDKGYAFGAMLTDLSKAFDCIVHDLLIAKLHAYGFDNSSLNFIHNYLTNRKQRVKINLSFSAFNKIKFGVPQGSILGPLLFNIYICDMFLYVDDIEIAGYADDNTPYTQGLNSESVISSLQLSTSKLMHWFKANYMKLNADKCHMLLSENCSHKSVVKVDNEEIVATQCEKLLGVNIDGKLTFEKHINTLCEKARRKVQALSRVANYIDFDKRRVLMKSFIQSQFNYCPLIWMMHSRKLENKINKIHERSLRIVYNDSNASFENLLERDQSVSVHQKNLQYLAIELYKRKNNLSPEIMNEVFMIRDVPHYNIRNFSEFQRNLVKSVKYGEKSLSYLAPIIWSLVPREIRLSESLESFKKKISSWKTEKCPCKLCKPYLYQVGFL